MERKGASKKTSIGGLCATRKGRMPKNSPVMILFIAASAFAVASFGCSPQAGSKARDQVAPLLASIWPEIESDARYGVDAKERDGEITPVHSAARFERIDRYGELVSAVAGE